MTKMYSPDFFMPLSELMENYAPVYPVGHSWENTFKYLLDTPSEKKIIDNLMDQMTRSGSLREPITLSSRILLDADQDDEDYDANDKLSVLNGTHRVCAAYILGWDKVKVQVRYKWQSMSDEEVSNDYVETQVTFPPDTNWDDDQFDNIFDVVRSIPISDKEWVTSSLMSNTQGTLSILWDMDASDANDALFEKIDRHVYQHLVEAGFDKGVIAMTHIDSFDD